MKIKTILSILIVVLSGAACDRKEPAPVLNFGTQNNNKSGTHIVREGDTVFDIAQRYKISMRSLIARNNLSAPYRIDEGARLVLPPPNAYKVKLGDSLYTVSRTFGVDTSRLSRLNNLSAPYRIYPDQILKIPDDVPVVSAPTRYSSTPASVSSNRSTAPTARSKPRIVSKAPPSRSGGRFGWPVRGKVLSSYGPKANGLHNDGINIAGRKGEPVKSAENGVVVYTGNQIQGFGNLILVRHADRYMTAYGHLDQIGVKKGQTITKGDIIGKIGSSGNVASPQLHFEIRRGTKALNPQQYL